MAPVNASFHSCIHSFLRSFYGECCGKFSKYFPGGSAVHPGFVDNDRQTWYTLIMGSDDNQSRKYFTPMMIFTEVMYVLCIIMVMMWLLFFRGGFGWKTEPDLELNYHPLFMILGLVFLNGEAMLVYRVFDQTSKYRVKLLHAGTQIGTFIFIAVGMIAVTDYKNLRDDPVDHLYSLHSWLGVTAILLFVAQWLCGLIFFLSPWVSNKYKALYKQIHVWLGLSLFGLILGVSFTGLMTLSPREHYTGEAFMVNCIALLLMVLGFANAFILGNPAWARQEVVPAERIPLQIQ